MSAKGDTAAGRVGSRSRDPNLWRPLHDAELRALAPTWRCRACGTWARGASCTTGVCTECDAPRDTSPPLPSPTAAR